jgi:hypothetical protein
VLVSKRDAIYALRTALEPLTLVIAAGSGVGKSTMSVSGHAYDGGEDIGALVYKSGASQAAPALGDDLSGWTGLTLTEGSAEITATGGHKLVVAAKDASGKAVATSEPVTVVAGA